MSPQQDLLAEVVDLGQAVGLLGADGDLDTSWFDAPLTRTAQVFGDDGQRRALLDLLDGVLGQDPGARPRPGERWYALLPGGGIGNLYLTVDDSVAGRTRVAEPGRPVVTDTGHIAVTVHDREGVDEIIWYRGPLVPYALTRDTLGPYHSADQCRRVTPETGAEDISYAGAFEIGRLLAAADQRLAIELARWRRGAYARSAQQDVVTLFDREMPSVLLDDLRAYVDRAIVPVVSNSLVPRITAGIGPVADRYGIDVIKDAPGLDPGLVQVAWRLPSLDVSRAVLGFDSTPVGGLGRGAIEVDVPAGPATLDEVLADDTGRQRLEAARAGLVERAARRVQPTGGGTP